MGTTLISNIFSLKPNHDGLRFLYLLVLAWVLNLGLTVPDAWAALRFTKVVTEQLNNNTTDSSIPVAAIRLRIVSRSLYAFTKQPYVQDIYTNQAHVDSIYKNMNVSGAYRRNREYEQDSSRIFYAEEQRVGRHLLIAGLSHDRTDWIKDGLHILNYAFIAQEASGRVPSGDENHSVTLFMAALSDAILTLEGSPYRKKFRAELDTLKAKFLSCASYYSDKARLQNFHANISQYTRYTHRRYVQGVWSLTAWMLTSDPEYRKIAESAIQDGLAQQTSEGVNPENGGFDVSYQAVSINYGLFCREILGPGDPLSQRLADMARRSMQWLNAFIRPSGEVITTGSSRSAGQEITRTGKLKQPNIMEMCWTLTKFGIIMKQSYYINLARQMEKRHNLLILHRK